jgi:hypothetical protein
MREVKELTRLRVKNTGVAVKTGKGRDEASTLEALLHIVDTNILAIC